VDTGNLWTRARRVGLIIAEGETCGVAQGVARVKLDECECARLADEQCPVAREIRARADRLPGIRKTKPANDAGRRTGT